MSRGGRRDPVDARVPPPVSPRAGTTLVEAVVALLVGALLVHLVLSSLEAQRRAVAGLAGASEALSAVRMGRHLVGGDARAWSDTLAASAVGPDSFSLRIVRGMAVVCAAPGPDLVVRTSGVRAPDPAKDSVVVLTATGVVRSAALAASESASGDGCPDGPGRTYRWSLDPAVPVVLARYFERGSFHLADGALRYRRGAAGRQPLTPEVVDPASAFDPQGAAVLYVARDTLPWRIRLGR